MAIPDISYLILNYNPDGERNAEEVLQATIDTFYERKSRSLTSEVFLLDQGTTADHQVKILEKQRQHGFSTILLNRNVGISRAINLFVRTCKSPVAALITSDVLITTGMDEDLYRKVQIPEVYQATPHADKSDVDYQIWTPEAAYGSDHVDLAGLKRQGRPMMDRLFGKDDPGYFRCIAVEFNVIFWRREIFDRIGFFDERWKASFENNDFSLRCFLDGGCTAISTESFVWHYHKLTHKNGSRYRGYEDRMDQWRGRVNGIWEAKWPSLGSWIDIYGPLKDRTVRDYPEFYDRFKHNIRLPYEQVYDEW